MATNALGQRPKFEKKLVGIVEYVTGDKVVQFTLTEDGKTFSNGTTKLKVNLDDLPATPRLAPNDKSRKQLRIRMSADGTEVEALTPVTGVFNLQLKDLGPRPEGKDSDPMPKLRVWNEGTDKENKYLEFFAIYEIIDGKFKGASLPAYNMHYKFEEDSNNLGFTRFAGNFDNKKSTRLFQLRDWGEIHGLWSEPIEWDDDTILPTLLERALSMDVKVRGVFKGGYITELLPLEEDDIEPFGVGTAELSNDEIDNELDNLDDVTKIEVKKEVKQTPKVLTKVKKISKNKPVAVAEEDDL